MRIKVNKLKWAKSRRAHPDSMGLMLQERASRKGQRREQSNYTTLAQDTRESTGQPASKGRHGNGDRLSQTRRNERRIANTLSSLVYTNYVRKRYD
jgi:hypothetical protein